MHAGHMVTYKQGGLQGTRILLVEDEVSERLVLAQYLEKLGCRLYLADDGLDALSKALVVKPDLVLMEVRMPVLDGVSSCRMMKDDPRLADIPVIFVSAVCAPDDRVQGLAAGAVDYISKPYNLEEVRLRLGVHLRLTGKPPPLQATLLSPKGPPLNNLDNILYQTARGRMLQHLSESPDLKLLAESVGTNARRLNEAFRQCTGMTVFELLREERMQEACRLLVDTEMEVQDIAMELGYTSGANFATAFRERFGVSPTQYRTEPPPTRVSG
jgi:DNA-binding response OmpR family regulator